MTDGLRVEPHAYDRSAALWSLHQHDDAFPRAGIVDVLSDPRNAHLLEYVSEEAFTHVFPGDEQETSSERLLSDLHHTIARSPSFHLWANIPLCRYRCNFCQFPILVLNHQTDTAEATARRWVDANIAEAGLWLAAVPSMRQTPVGEFCLFGGTPTAVPPAELDRLLTFYRKSFRFTEDTSLRAEGSPDSITDDHLGVLAAHGFHTLTYGVQSFDDELLRLANRRHTGQQALAALRNARARGFDRVDADLVWGLPGQSVDGFLRDVDVMVDEGFDTVVMIKLHLRSFAEVQSAIGHVSPAVWEDAGVRARIAAEGHAWPTLGQQYQMREMAVEKLLGAGYYEHPTTYFPKKSLGPQRWRSLNLDQHLQVPQVGIGLGGYSWSDLSEASAVTRPATYLQEIDAGRIPFDTITAISPRERETRAIRMALSTCQPLRADVHGARFPESESLLRGHWGERFLSLERRGLAQIDRAAGTVTLTSSGATLVEAIMQTEIR
ncbi:radical SAM protein [Micromonospora schwarzwaldensis]|uniref:radical SAM protein n=1 Tax=Micromonospora sp. DSM 45708 TaxID=3111767 RepID=UPI0031DE2D92